MSVATLLNVRDPAFDFEHRMAHEAMLTAQALKTNVFSGLPYWLDPAYGDPGVPAGWQNSLHSQAHADFISLFPSPYGGSTVSLTGVSLEPHPDAWWEFNNHQLHYIANQVS